MTCCILVVWATGARGEFEGAINRIAYLQPPMETTASSPQVQALASDPNPVDATVQATLFDEHGLAPGLSSCQPVAAPSRRALSSCEAWPNFSIAPFLSYDSYQGIVDHGWSNYGVVVGFNSGMRLGSFSDLTGIGGQIGASYGVYGWTGTDYRLQNDDQAQTQGFLTYGLFNRAMAGGLFNAALVQDWMFVDNFGIFGENVVLSQLRGWAGWNVTPRNELGVWGAWHVVSDTRDVPFFGPTTYRSINQFNVFWHHKWNLSRTDSYIWAGVPQRDGLQGAGSLGDYIAGALANVPIGRCVSLFALVTYMHPSSSPGPSGGVAEIWNFTTGLTFTRRGANLSDSVSGRCWMPQLPLANNGYFMSDVSQAY